MKSEILQLRLQNAAVGAAHSNTPTPRLPKLSVVVKVLLLSGLAVGLAACGSNRSSKPHINNKTKFSVKEYGVAASPRVTTSKRVRRGGGRAQVGKRYKVRGKWYYPREQPGYDKIGNASWYGPNFHGRLTANGEIYDQYALSGAHPTFPLPSYARVTNLANGNSVVVRVNDRGPYSSKRIIDMSAKAAELLDYKRQGIARVRVQYLGKARLDGRDERFLTASFKPGKGYRRSWPGLLPARAPTEVLIASNRPRVPVGNLAVSSFAKLPYPKERPVTNGGVPVNFGFLPQNRALSNAPLTNKPSKTLESFSPPVAAKIRNGFIISSYVMGKRISAAHLAARLVGEKGLGNLLNAEDVRRWKNHDH